MHERTTLSRIAESPRIKKKFKIKCKAPVIRDWGFCLYAVQRHRALGELVVFIENPCYMLKAVLLCYKLQSRRHVCCLGIASPTQVNRWIVLAFFRTFL